MSSVTDITIQSSFAMLCEIVYNPFFLGCEFGEKSGLHGFCLRFLGPRHQPDYILGVLDEGGDVGGYEAIAAAAVAVGDTSRKGENIAHVALGEFGGDYRAAFDIGFGHGDAVGHSRHNPVSGQEESTVYCGRVVYSVTSAPPLRTMAAASLRC